MYYPFLDFEKLVGFTAVCDNGCGPGVCLAPNFCGNCNSINHVSPTCEGELSYNKIRLIR